MTDTPTPDDILGIKSDDTTAAKPEADTSLTGQPVPKATEHPIDEKPVADVSGGIPAAPTAVSGTLADPAPAAESTAGQTPDVGPVSTGADTTAATPSAPDTGEMGTKPGQPQPQPAGGLPTSGASPAPTDAGGAAPASLEPEQEE